ncbi:MAG: TIGR02466 family protein [Pseudomonadota bacterium]
MSQSNTGPTGPVEFHQLFAVSVLETRLADAKNLNAQLLQVITAQKNQSAGMQRSNINGWHSTTDMLRWGGEAAKSLAIAMLQTVGAYTRDVGMRDGQARFEMAMDMWANVSPRGAANQFHAHAGALWSGVYYVDDGGDSTASLVLLDPNFPTNRMYAPDLQATGPSGESYPSQREFSPEPGKLIIFPSWLTHGVKPHQGARERVSIAMNVMALPLKPTNGPR